MSVYVLKCYEPHPRDPDITRRDPDPDNLDRLKISVYANNDIFECEYGIVEFPGFEPALTVCDQSRVETAHDSLAPDPNARATLA